MSQDGKALRDLTCATCAPGIDIAPGKNDSVSDHHPMELKRSPLRASYLVTEENRAEIQELSGDLAVVSPFIDGRLKDVGVDSE